MSIDIERKYMKKGISVVHLSHPDDFKIHGVPEKIPAPAKLFLFRIAT